MTLCIARTWKTAIPGFSSPLSYSTDACVLFSMAKGLFFKRIRNFDRTTDWKIPVNQQYRDFQVG